MRDRRALVALVLALGLTSLVGAPIPAGAWGGTQTVSIPAAALRASGANLIDFMSTRNFPNWNAWGVRGVSLSAGT